MYGIHRMAAVLATILAAAPATFALKNGLALTPPMGFNTWNWFGGDRHGLMNDSLIRGVADAMVSSGMRDSGYHYLCIDDGWAESNRDIRGGMVPSLTRFPNFRNLVSYVHGKGLGIGLYSDVAARTCGGTMPGSLNHEQQDADSLVAWGVDYLKFDYCGGSNALVSYVKMRDCLKNAVAKARAAGNASAHEILYSICNWGVESPWLWGDTVGNMWRTTYDIGCSWNSIIGILDFWNVTLYPYARPGSWNDPDMLEVGNGLPINEDRAHFSLWCMMAAPLIAGNDVRNMTAAVRTILTNGEVIAVDQDSMGFQGRRAGSSDQVLVKRMRDSSRVVLLFNNTSAAATISFTWANAWLPSNEICAARNLWTHQNLGNLTGSYSASVPSHDVVMLRLYRSGTFIANPVATPAAGTMRISVRPGAISRIELSALPAGRAVRIELCDLRGGIVRSLRVPPAHGACYSFDACDNAGRPLAKGGYVVRVLMGNVGISRVVNIVR